MTTSAKVAKPRKNANPRTEPTVNHHNTAAARNDTVSAASTVRHAPSKLRCAELRKVRPEASSSFKRSKNTM